MKKKEKLHQEFKKNEKKWILKAGDEKKKMKTWKERSECTNGDNKKRKKKDFLNSPEVGGGMRYLSKMWMKKKRRLKWRKSRKISGKHERNQECPPPTQK